MKLSDIKIEWIRDKTTNKFQTNPTPTPNDNNAKNVTKHEHMNGSDENDKMKQDDTRPALKAI